MRGNLKTFGTVGVLACALAASAEQAMIQRYQADAETGRRNGWNTSEIDRAVQSMTADNARERAALDDVQRSLSGRG